MNRTVNKLVVVGASAGGLSAASRARRVNPGLEIVVFEKTEHVSVGFCELPYLIAGYIKDRREVIAVSLENLREKRNLDVRIRHDVLGINPTAKTVTYRDLELGKECEIAYDRLVLSPGASPIRPPIPGLSAPNVFVLHSLADADAIINYIRERGPKNAVIVGGGYIGLEMAEALSRNELSVTIVEMLPNVLGTMDDELTSLVEAHLEKQGVGLALSSPLEKVVLGEDGYVRAVVAGGKQYPADMVFLALGIRPNVRLAKEAKIQLGGTGAIATDWKQKTSDESIFAAGDCCESQDIVTGRKVWVALGTTANKQGRIAGDNAAGGYSVFKGITSTAISKTFDIEIGRGGLTEKEAKKLGLDYETVVASARSRSGTYPGARKMRVKLVFERVGGRLLGGQVVGEDGVLARTNVLACALFNRLTVEEAARYDLAYSPPFAPVWDAVLVACNLAVKKVKAR
ncbi:MAG TPA: FAD-dependent oxidoreductase [bacterium]|nr:FAD-dependent oxidoreductase [bacterium]